VEHLSPRFEKPDFPERIMAIVRSQAVGTNFAVINEAAPKFGHDASNRALFLSVLRFFVLFCQSEVLLKALEDPMTDLPTSDLPKTELPTKRRTGQRVRHCRQCFRDDYHKPIKFGALGFSLLMIFTLGIFYFFRPCRCTTCGTRRTW